MFLIVVIQFSNNVVYIQRKPIICNSIYILSFYLIGILF